MIIKIIISFLLLLPYVCAYASERSNGERLMLTHSELPSRSESIAEALDEVRGTQHPIRYELMGMTPPIHFAVVDQNAGQSEQHLNDDDLLTSYKASACYMSGLYTMAVGVAAKFAFVSSSVACFAGSSLCAVGLCCICGGNYMIGRLTGCECAKKQR